MLSSRLLPSRLLPLFAITIGFALAACTPLDKDSGQPLEHGTGTDTPSPLAALHDDKQKVAWVIGSQVGLQLAPLQNEIDFPTLMRAARHYMEGKGQALDQNEALAVMLALSERMQTGLQADAEKNRAEGQAFLQANGQKPGITTTTTGLQYEVLSEGTGRKPGAMDTVRVHYEGRLLNGEVFDSSYARGEPAEFSLDGVVPGWREGVMLMPVGSKYRLWMPGFLGYGESGTPGGPIGPNATLVFDVELLDIIAQ